MEFICAPCFCGITDDTEEKDQRLQAVARQRIAKKKLVVVKKNQIYPVNSDTDTLNELPQPHTIEMVETDTENGTANAMTSHIQLSVENANNTGIAQSQSQNSDEDDYYSNDDTLANINDNNKTKTETETETNADTKAIPSKFLSFEYRIATMSDIVDCDLFLYICEEILETWNEKNQSDAEKQLDIEYILGAFRAANVNGKRFALMKKTDFKSFFPASMKNGHIQKLSIHLKKYDVSVYNTYAESERNSDEEALAKLDSTYDYYEDGYPMEEMDVDPHSHEQRVQETRISTVRHESQSRALVAKESRKNVNAVNVSENGESNATITRIINEDKEDTEREREEEVVLVVTEEKETEFEIIDKNGKADADVDVEAQTAAVGVHDNKSALSPLNYEEKTESLHAHALATATTAT